MKNKRLLVILGIFISLSMVNVDYGMYPILRKHKFLTKQRGKKVQTRAYSSQNYGKNQGFVNNIYQYLKNKWNDTFSRHVILKRKHHLAAKTRPIEIPSGIPSEKVLTQKNYNWFAGKSTGELMNILLEGIAIDAFGDNTKNLSFREKQRLSYEIKADVEKRYETLNKLLNKEKEVYRKNENNIVLYKPMAKSEAVLYNLMLQKSEHTSFGSFDTGKFGSGEILSINTNNDNNWRLSPFCQGDNNNENAEDLKNSILSQAIRGEKPWNNNSERNQYTSDAGLREIAVNLVDTHFNRMEKKGFHVRMPKEFIGQVDTCIDAIVNFLKIANNEVVIAQAIVSLDPTINLNDSSKNTVLKDFLEKKSPSIFLDETQKIFAMESY